MLRDFNPPPAPPAPLGLDFGVETLELGALSGGAGAGSLNGGSVTDEDLPAPADLGAAAEGLQARSALTQSNLAALMAVDAGA